MSNWTQLNADIPLFAERDVSTDSEFVQAMPTFIANAEKRIYDECPFTLFNEQVDDTMTAGSPFIARPVGMKRSGAMLVNVNGVGFTTMIAQTRAYLAEFWPTQVAAASSSKPPRYWAAYDATTLLVAPTPSQAYAYRLLFQGDLAPLSNANQTGPLTENHYDLLLAAALVEAFRYSHEDQAAVMAERWEVRYQEAKAAAVANDLGISMSDFVPAAPRSTGA
jgi:hypothetical protein